jgi:hypothetical protein
MIARFLCYLRHHHNPVRHPLGGFKCSDCGEAGADLEQMGFVDGGYVMPDASRLLARPRRVHAHRILGAQRQGLVGPGSDSSQPRRPR